MKDPFLSSWEFCNLVEGVGKGLRVCLVIDRGVLGLWVVTES